MHFDFWEAVINVHLPVLPIKDNNKTKQNKTVETLYKANINRLCDGWKEESNLGRPFLLHISQIWN